MNTSQKNWSKEYCFVVLFLIPLFSLKRSLVVYNDERKGEMIMVNENKGQAFICGFLFDQISQKIGCYVGIFDFVHVYYLYMHIFYF